MKKGEKNRRDICNVNNGNNGKKPNENIAPETPFVDIEDLDESGNIKLQCQHNVNTMSTFTDRKNDKEFQAKQSREARERLKKEGMIED